MSEPEIEFPPEDKTVKELDVEEEMLMKLWGRHSQQRKLITEEINNPKVTQLTLDAQFSLKVQLDTNEILLHILTKLSE